MRAGSYVHEAMLVADEEAFQVCASFRFRTASGDSGESCYCCCCRCSVGQDVRMTSAQSGVYVCGDYEINLQTAEVYTKVRY